MNDPFDPNLFEPPLIDAETIATWGIFIVPALFWLYCQYLRWRQGK
jgi:hypothetical protein